MLRAIRDAGFVDIEFERRPVGDIFDFATSDPMLRAAIDAFGQERARKVAETVFSYSIRARKPA